MLKRQREIVIGTLLGDAYLQKVGKRTARLKFEHPEKQKEYIFWKYEELKNYMQEPPKKITRYNPTFKKTYTYYRCQSFSSPIFGKFRRWFYPDGKKHIPKNIENLLTPLALAVWYMDNGYFYKRDKDSYIYIPRYSDQEIKLLLSALKKFELNPKKVKKGKHLYLYFPKDETQKLFSVIGRCIHPCMKFKIGE